MITSRIVELMGNNKKRFISCNSKALSINTHNIIDAGYKFVYDNKKYKVANIYIYEFTKKSKSQKKIYPLYTSKLKSKMSRMFGLN